MGDRPPLPGAIGVSHLRVYDSIAPDGHPGGTPHLHTVCTEAYAVIAGTGAVQTVSGDGYREVELEAGALVWFTPGTVHRVINGGGLEIFVLMQNAGLPEAGDMVITFDPAVRADAAAYAQAATLPAGRQTTAGPDDAARERRDAAVTWFVELRVAAQRGDLTPLYALYGDAARLVGGRAAAWRDTWRQGPMAEAQRTGDLLGALEQLDASHLRASSVHRHVADDAERRMGCCGTLGQWVDG